jgi:hypothetical protein
MNQHLNLARSYRGVKPWRVLVKALILCLVFALVLNSFPNLGYYAFKHLVPKQTEATYHHR